jgi:hypothetical protein
MSDTTTTTSTAQGTAGAPPVAPAGVAMPKKKVDPRLNAAKKGTDNRQFFDSADYERAKARDPAKKEELKQQAEKAPHLR